MSGAMPLLGAGRDNLVCAFCGVMMRCAHRDLTVLYSVTDCCATLCCRERPEMKVVAFEFRSCLWCVGNRYCWGKLCFKKVSVHEVVVILDRYVAEFLSLENAYCGPECWVR